MLALLSAQNTVKQGRQQIVTILAKLHHSHYHQDTGNIFKDSENRQ